MSLQDHRKGAFSFGASQAESASETLTAKKQKKNGQETTAFIVCLDSQRSGSHFSSNYSINRCDRVRNIAQIECCKIKLFCSSGIDSSGI